MTNRLAQETSPYLLQHANNPVNWYPWREEALARARAENKAILLSIGYAACHWCHVMESESFEDPETAQLMNELFVNIKVDREERPDLDNVYMTALQAMTGHGGWPMTIFLTPDGKPFYGGTYYPPEPRHGMPAFREVLKAVHDAWVNQQDDVQTKADELVDHVGRLASLPGSTQHLSEQTLNRAAGQMLQAIDPEWGGFGEGMKFPQSPNIDFLLRMAVAHDYPGAREDVVLTLDKMARGGIFDHVGGGFHRYAVDRTWLVPHFEKMLYDNAQLIRLYARAWQVTGSDLYRDTAIATGEWMLREMQDQHGGFYSSLDADSEGVEGKFYVWSHEKLGTVLGDDMPLAVAMFALSAEGNWEGTNVLWRPRTDEEVAEQAGKKVDEVRATVARVRTKLMRSRSQRERPATDDKAIASWNGMAIAGLAEAGRILDRPDFVSAARRAAQFTWDHMRTDGRLARSWRDGKLGPPGFLDDHAMLADGYLTLYETTFDPVWFERSMELVRAMLQLFPDPVNGGLFDTGADVPAIVVRPKDIFDNAMPSGNAAASDVLLRLAALDGDPYLERSAIPFLRTIEGLATRSPLGFGAALSAIDLSVTRAVEVAVVGDPAMETSRALIEAAFGSYMPNRVVAAGPEGSLVPALLADRPLRNGAACAYVCRDFACGAPVSEPADLREQLT